MKLKPVKNILLAATTFLAAQTVNAQSTDSVTDDPDIKYATEPSLDGKTVSLSDYRGHTVVLDFWASWCPDCRKEAPAVVEMHRQYKDKGIVFIGVSFDNNREAWANAVKKFGIEYTQVGNLQKWKETEISKAYHVNWIPSMYVIDANGKVVLGTVVTEKVKALLDLMTSETK